MTTIALEPSIVDFAHIAPPQPEVVTITVHLTCLKRNDDAEIPGIWTALRIVVDIHLLDLR